MNHQNGVSLEFYAAIVKVLPSCGIRNWKVLGRKDVAQALSELENALKRPDIPVVAGMGPMPGSRPILLDAHLSLCF